ncbi:MAG: hypothetical protein AAF307_12515 [Pseudomonadota bacterium]
MLDKPQTLHVSQEEIEVIEAALQTQSQILNVQATAGGNAARTRLNLVKSILARLSENSQRPAPAPVKRRPCAGFLNWLRPTQPGC